MTDLSKSLRHTNNFNPQLFNQTNLFNRLSILYMFYFHVNIQQYQQSYIDFQRSLTLGKKQHKNILP